MTVDVVVRILGPLEVERSGAPIPIGSPKQRRLLTALATAAGSTVSVDRLVAALWDHDAPASARNSLQSYVARLREALGPDVILTRPDGYELAPIVEVDVRAFHDALAVARDVVDHAPDRAVAELTEALASWRGEACAEFDDQAARDEAARLREQRLQARQLLAAAHRACGDHDRAVGELDRLLAEDPLREHAVLDRARSLAAGGRVPEALDGLRAYRQRLADDLGLDPSPAVDELERELLQGETRTVVGDVRTRPTPSRPAAPPRLGNPTVGRDEELGRIQAALGTARLVSLVGPGGVGKTRLATEACGRLDRAAWVDLAPVRTDEDVAAAIADTLGVVASGGEAVAATLPGMLARFRGTVVVDNCEHVIDRVADLVDATLAEPGEVRFLTTTRERLDVAGELVVPITPLRVPSPAEATERDPAVRLFLDRLDAAGGAPVSPADAASVASAVDGLPLAIELAAARAATLPVPALVERLRDHLDVLAGTRRRHGDRHRTLTQVIDWSYDLLAPEDQVLFRRLSAFAATFRLEDAERICADEQLKQGQVAPALSRLAEQSMVTVLEPGRYRLLEPLRLFAAALLTDREEAAGLEWRQRQAALELAERADRAVTGPGEAAVVEEVEPALADLRAVHARAVAAGDDLTIALLAGRLYRLAYAQARVDVLSWGEPLARSTADLPAAVRARAVAAAAAGAWMAGRVVAAVELAELAASLGDDDPWVGITVAEALGDARHMTGDRDGAVAAFRRAVELAEHLGHDGLAALGEASLALTLAFHGEVGEAGRLARAAVERAESVGAPSALALSHYALGEVLADVDPERALAALDRARSVATSINGRLVEGAARTADVALRGRHGEPGEARRRYRDAIELWRDAGAAGPLLTALRNLVVLLVRIGDDADALTLHAAVQRLADTASFGVEAGRLAAAVEAARERLGPEAAAAAEAAARRTDLGDLANHALELLGGA